MGVLPRVAQVHEGIGREPPGPVHGKGPFGAGVADVHGFAVTVGRHGDPRAQVGHHQIQIFIALAHFPGHLLGHRPVVQGMVEAGAVEAREPRDPGHGFHFVRGHGVHDEGPHLRLAGEFSGQEGPQVRGMLPMLRLAKVLHHGVVDLVHPSGDGVHETPPAHHGVQRVQGDPRVPKGGLNELKAVVVLIRHPGELGQVGGGVFYAFFQQGGLPLKYSHLGGGGAGVDGQNPKGGLGRGGGHVFHLLSVFIATSPGLRSPGRSP
ncbi:MAG: hypothetical protein BWY88_00690 [Synergistetes bacterium ADurb.Bin520]|nr:MAG: hypothetical protein BWY88_00690 [Synergistetes bacterium ADurb.Bin520]